MTDTSNILFKLLERERKRHERALDGLLKRASAIDMYVPGANPFLYPGTFRGPFRAEPPVATATCSKEPKS